MNHNNSWWITVTRSGFSKVFRKLFCFKDYGFYRNQCSIIEPLEIILDQVFVIVGFHYLLRMPVVHVCEHYGFAKSCTTFFLSFSICPVYHLEPVIFFFDQAPCYRFLQYLRWLPLACRCDHTNLYWFL